MNPLHRPMIDEADEYAHVISLFEKLVSERFASCGECKVVPRVSRGGDKFNDVQFCDACRVYWDAEQKKREVA